VRRAAITALATLAALAGTAAAVLAAPPRLSTEGGAPNISSTYGSGAFGTWSVDAHKLPAYRYEIDELTSPIAPQPELSGNTNAWSQLGNDRIVADASNHGYTQLWSQDRLYQWTNYYDPAHDHFAGGFGYLNLGGRVISTMYDDRAAGASTTRAFGVGYYEQRTTATGLTVQGRVYAPFGDDSLLLHDVTIKNTSKTAVSGSYFEYWDLNPEIQGVTQIPRGYEAPTWDPQTHTLSAAQLPDDVDTEPLTIFASALQSPVSAYDTDTNAFFGSGTRAAPAGVVAGQLTNSSAPPAANGQEGSGMFAMQSPVSLAPGASVTLRYAYGYGHPESIQPMLSRYSTATNAFNQSEAQWSRWLPKAQIGSGYEWLSRELEWDAYTLRSDSTYEDCAGRHILSQGGYYQYFFGENEAFRDPLQHALPMIWADPALARDVIAYSAEEQPVGTGSVPYGMLGLCRRFDLGTADDLDQWLLWAAAEYALSTRDFAFLSQQLSYYAGVGAGTLWEHLKLAFHHQEEVVGRGAHGEYLTGGTGDWNDFSTEFNQMTESNLVTAQASYIYPRLALVADRRGDSAFAAELRAAGARDKAIVAGQWIEGEHVTPADAGMGWFARGYSGASQLGAGAIYVEPQPWTLLAGTASARQASEVVAAYRRFLVGVGAPFGPTQIGAAMAPGSTDPGANEQNEPGLNNSREFPGGAWFALDGQMTWALADLDGVVPEAAADAWDEFTRDTLATHATVFPDHWDGVISVDDECASYYQSPPSGCGIGLATGAGAVNGYDTQIMHQPAYALFDLLKLAGVEATQAGYDVVPHLPAGPFDVRLPGVGVAEQSGLIRGYVTTSGGDVEMRVAPPPGVAPGQVSAFAGGTQVPYTVVEGLVQFTLPTKAGRPADWAVSGP
jgi:Glycosyl hydrolase 36 superfamily, catalytic domain/Glycosyltransferase family 36